MVLRRSRFFWLTITAASWCAAARADETAVDFNREVRPILSDKCFFCHGPDVSSREADLRLDESASALEDRGGYAAVVPGRPEESELLRRILSDDEHERMPPAETGKSLAPAEIETLRRWIAEGAEWALPWAYVPPRRDAPLPAKREGSANWIDDFLAERWERERIAPQPETDRVTLLRRASFDLTGLPPTPAEVDAFVADDSPRAWEKVVERLLASPRYGERMAVFWLDLVRFADTVGYHGDQDHSVWPYRDYVIHAFNTNKPFDEFTREQLAGDLIDGAGIDATIASAYNRLLQTTHEGGAQLKEYRAIYMADRVRNVSQTWMGATVGCAQCHDHKYDPYTTADFHALGAFFADVDDEHHLENQYDNLNSLPTPRRPELTVLSVYQRERIAELRAELAPLDAERDAERITATAGEIAAIAGAPGRVMITKRLPEPREVRVLPRGNWLDESGPIVLPAVPQFLQEIPAEGLRTVATARVVGRAGESTQGGEVSDAELRGLTPRGSDRKERLSRLDLANWLVDHEHGAGLLTARVMANRSWALLFGRGIAMTLDDFGGQGHAPDHPELLDRLAVELVDSGWDVKHMLRLIVLSRAYRQSSAAPAELLRQDPLNALFARQARYRVPAEMVRDTALAHGGLLVEKLGGPSAKPYQPAKYYRHLNFPEREYRADKDANQWRRGAYVHWQRQFLHPAMKALDAPTREECTAQRPQSNTPVASLTLLNDPEFVEAARGLATRAIAEGGTEFDQRLTRAFRICLSRAPTADERAVMERLLAEHRTHYEANPADAEAALAVGLWKRDEKREPAATIELASWAGVARAVLNASETFTRN